MNTLQLCFISGEFTLFCRKLKYVAKYAFFVLFLGLKYSSVLFCTLFPSLKIYCIFLEYISIYVRDGKSVQNSTDEYFSPKNSTKNAYFTTYFNSRQNSVNSLEINQVAEH